MHWDGYLAKILLWLHLRCSRWEGSTVWHITNMSCSCVPHKQHQTWLLSVWLNQPTESVPHMFWSLLSNVLQFLWDKMREAGSQPSARCNCPTLLYWLELYRGIEEQSPHSNLTDGHTPFQGKLTIITLFEKIHDLFSHNKKRYCAGWNVLWKDVKYQTSQKKTTFVELASFPEW